MASSALNRGYCNMALLRKEPEDWLGYTMPKLFRIDIGFWNSPIWCKPNASNSLIVRNRLLTPE